MGAVPQPEGESATPCTLAGMVRGPVSQCLVALVFAAGLLAVALPARAALELAPSRDGHWGAWLVAGPFAPSALAKLRPANGRIQQGAAVPGSHVRWRVLASRAEALDLREELQCSGQEPAFALVGGVLRLARSLDGWLLLGVDGGARLSIDGAEVWSRDTPHLRDGAWEVIPLQLPPGDHILLLQLHKLDPHWALRIRLLQAQDLLPPTGASLVLPGVDPTEAQDLTRALLSVDCVAELKAEGYRPAITVDFPRGVPLHTSLSVRVSGSLVRGGPWLDRLSLGDVSINESGVQPLRAGLPLLALGDRPDLLQLETRVGSLRERCSLELDGRAREAVARVRRLQQHLSRTTLKDAALIEATLRWYVLALSTVRQRRPGLAGREVVTELQRLEDQIRSGEDPLTRPGVVELARVSRLHQEPQPFLVHIPASFDPAGDRTYPLVVLLHGYNGSPRGILSAFLGGQHAQPRAAVDGFVVAPHAFGNTFYRGPGETEVLDTVDWMLATYPIDPHRVAVSGVSMGGTGAAHLALRYPNRFSAAAPLCGYHSYFVRRDVAGKPLRPWEELGMHSWSPASWAASGLHLPFFVAQGTKDYPLDNSRVLIAALRARGYSVVDEWPETGHQVWVETYSQGRLWPWLTRWSRPEDPSHVALSTDSLRHGKVSWVEVLRLLPRLSALADVDARITGGRLLLRTSGVAALRLTPPRPEGPITLEIDGAQLSYEPDEEVRAQRLPAGEWSKGARGPVPGFKRAGVEGPIRDAFLGPLAFSYGTGSPATLRANREVARQLARAWYGDEIDYPVLPDVTLADPMIDSHSLVLVGTLDDHALLARLAPLLPIRAQGHAVQVGTRALGGAGSGCVFVYPNPLRPERYVLVVQGVDVPGTYAALSLPRILPDFLVYDGSLARAAGQQVLGDARVLAGGFFTESWDLPAEVADPVTSADGTRRARPRSGPGGPSPERRTPVSGL